MRFFRQCVLVKGKWENGLWPNVSFDPSSSIFFFFRIILKVEGYIFTTNLPPPLLPPAEPFLLPSSSYIHVEHIGAYFKKKNSTIF